MQGRGGEPERGVGGVAQFLVSLYIVEIYKNTYLSNIFSQEEDGNIDKQKPGRQSITYERKSISTLYTGQKAGMEILYTRTVNIRARPRPFPSPLCAIAGCWGGCINPGTAQALPMLCCAVLENLRDRIRPS